MTFKAVAGDGSVLYMRSPTGEGEEWNAYVSICLKSFWKVPSVAILVAFTRLNEEKIFTMNSDFIFP